MHPIVHFLGDTENQDAGTGRAEVIAHPSTTFHTQTVTEHQHDIMSQLDAVAS